MEVEITGVQPQAKECLEAPETEVSPNDFSGSMALPIPWFQISGLQKWDNLSYLKNIYVLIMLLQLSHPPLHSTPSCPPPSSHIPPTCSSCPWAILISSLASTFPTLFLPSPCLFSTCHLCYLFSVPFPPFSPSHSPIDNPPCDLHFCGSVSVLVVCLVFFCFCFRCGC